jgi:CubicO group peptidase (beta-lactamase class C family)
MTSIAAMERTGKLLKDEVDEGTFCRGTQAYVNYRGEVIMDAGYGEDGLRRPMTSETLSTVYCTVKPMISCLVLLGEQEGTLSRDQTLGELLGVHESPAQEAVTLAELLTHTAGLHNLNSPRSAVTPPAIRREQALKAVPPEGWDKSSDAAYSEWLAFFLIGLVLERVHGRSLPELLRERLLEPIGIDDEVSLGLTPEKLERIGVNLDLREGRHLPLLIERTQWFVGAVDPSLNAYATMRGLGHFYVWVSETLNGRQTTPLEPERLRDACRPHRPVLHDQIMDTPVDWGLGFMTGLGRVGFGTYPSPRAVGHTGQVGTSIGFCDPEHDLAVALLFNGVIDQRLGAHMRRPATISAIYEDLGIEPASTGLSELEQAAIRKAISQPG